MQHLVFKTARMCNLCVYSYHDCVFSYSNYTGDQPHEYLLCSFACIITTVHVQPRQLQVPLINITMTISYRNKTVSVCK